MQITQYKKTINKNKFIILVIKVKDKIFLLY